MKKLLTLTFVVTALLFSSKVNAQAYKEGDKLLNVGVGLSSYYYGTPFGVSYESGINENISVGGQFDYNSGSYGAYTLSDWKYTAFYVGARGSYHLAPLLKLNDDKIDLYAGIGLGYQSFKWNDNGYGAGYSTGSGIFFNYFIGGKYYFTEKIGAFVELGYTGLSSSRLGLAVKF
jgi:Outer membrane protein beta-barrel domain